MSSKTFQEKNIHLLFSIFQKNLQENYSAVVFWKEFAFALYMENFESKI